MDKHKDEQKMEPKWKKFEKAVYEIQKQLAGDSEIKLDDSIMGVDSQVFRQIDISIHRHIAQYSILIVIDCKDHKIPVDVKQIEEFAGLVKDVRANKGAMISSKGFTQAALNFARAHGIDTLRLIDTESVDWNVYASVPVILHSTNFKGYNIIFKNFSGLPSNIGNTNIETLKVFSDKLEILGTIGNIIKTKWNNNEISDSEGEKEIVLAVGASLEIDDLKITPIDIYARIYVEKNYFIGNLPIHLKGLHDLQGGGIITQKIRTSPIEPYKIEQGLVKGWQKINNPDDLSIKPFMTLSVQDYLPIEDTKI